MEIWLVPPHMDNVDNFNKEDYHLHSVAIEEWEGFLFLNLNDHPEQFGKMFEPILDRFFIMEFGSPFYKGIADLQCQL
ncbi:MAG: hypothetical protein CM1200mP10_03320 [Candidatus Neomarinimicrobiota bacterium]|nr:MAG: hypothetical protein CM1200mP10_03320 [Candidatus Neomarinimicrobiota bacterium]